MKDAANVRILGVGSALPTRIVGNEEIERLTGIAAAHVAELFDVRERRWARRHDCAAPADGQMCSDLAAQAGRRAVDDAGLAIQDIDLLVAVTTTPDFVNPTFDHAVAAKLGLRGVPAFSVHAPCTGLFRGSLLAESLLRSGRATTALVVAADTISPFFRFGEEVPRDHKMSTALYADGAGAWVMRRTEAPAGAEMLAIRLVTNSSEDTPGILFRGLMSATPPSPESAAGLEYLGHHDFRRVLRRGGELAAHAARVMMEEMGVTQSDVRFFLTHQATGNLHRIAAAHGLPAERVPINIATVGNTISASILILLDELKRAGRLSPGDLLILHTAESSSWSYAAMAVRW
ncbi:MAG TPA: 3-oxoacyl-[acyl-carrier-protein] synthase III C-terminal domain-containing protein [Candidatus Limnocylindrales bacterium]|nr:3-oxoacyl-[acyl-carrier-protein] synthase III C-terminal domain-containing protein [Candidatus Limnocylindrales bacterium]